jgi:hypothetical protein
MLHRTPGLLALCSLATMCSFVATAASATNPEPDWRISEAMVLERFGTLDVRFDPGFDPGFDQRVRFNEEQPVPAPAPRGGAIRYAGPGCPFASIQAAVNASGDGDTVRVVTGSYNERVSILSKGINLIGGFASCSALAPDGRSTINRAGTGLGMDIFYPAATTDPQRTVNVENFVIRGGGGSGFDSGGALVEGRPGKLAVNFRNVQISDNQRADSGAGGSGAGLRIVTTGDFAGSAAAMTTLDNDSTVIRNTSGGDGGGVHCLSTHDAGGVTLLRMGTTLVFDNEAVNGGGIAVDGCKNVFLYNGGPVILIFPAGGILGNSAIDTGGAIAVRNGGDVWMRATEFAGFGDADEAALISANSASIGGAADVRDPGSRLRVEDAYVLDNSASQGAAFNVTLEGALEVFRRAGTAACDPIVSGGGVLSRPPCSVIDGNEASAGGGALNIVGPSSADISRSLIRNNTAGGSGGNVVRIANPSIYSGPNTEVRIEGSVIHDNSGSFVFDVAHNADLLVSHSTVADNPNTLVRVVAADDRFARARFQSSIIDTGTAFMSSLAGSGQTLFELDCMIGNVASGDTGATNIPFYSQIDPEFVDQDGRDYRLQATSPAIDYCDEFNPSLFPDLNGNPRGVAWTGPPTTVPPTSVNGGLVDLGAYEIPFEVTTTDLALRTEPPGQSSLFVDNGEQIRLTLVVQNQSSNIAYGQIELTGELGLDPVFGHVWSCAPPPGVTCSPASGSGNISTTISRVAPGDQVFFFVEADPLQPNQDQEFEYSAIVTESQFNVDSNRSNNTLLLEIRSGLFADGFE